MNTWLLSLWFLWWSLYLGFLHLSPFPHGKVILWIAAQILPPFWNVSLLFFCLCVCLLSHVRLFVTPWTVACQAPLSIGFPRQEYWSGLSFPSPGDLTEPGSPALQAESLPSEPQGSKLLFFFYSLITFNLSYLWYVYVSDSPSSLKT